jgi:hypothetical protein
MDLAFRADVLPHRGSFRIVAGPHGDWARFSAPQRRRLAAALVEHHPRYAGEASRILIVEILGRWLGHPAGLDALRRLFAQPLPAPARATLPHGLGRLVRAPGSPPEARADTRWILNALAVDPDPDERTPRPSTP